jgi:beta-lactamase superfamily II metal-dependent hydrolase
MITAGQLAYLDKNQGEYKTLKRAHNFKSPKEDSVSLLWGDEVYVISTSSRTATVSAQGHHFKIPLGDLTGDRILCVYQIDCGQGDAALVNFPDGRWMMVDGGPPHNWSNSGKIAPDFLYWKMFVDQSWKQEFNFQKSAFVIDALVVSHPDYDHYGGFLDMMSHLRAGTLEYRTVFHCGLGRYDGTRTKYQNGKGHSQLGPIRGNDLPDAYMTALIDDFGDVQKYETRQSRGFKLAGSFGKWLAELRQLRGDRVGNLKRVDASMKHLPGFTPGNSAYSIRLLGPIVEKWRNRPAMRYLDTAGVKSMSGPSRTRNGHSVVLRLDYDKARILLTGDLNFRSQALLLKNINKNEFKCHVAKACHHGSEDVSTTFLKAMSPMATIFSSGDNEDYAHPRAKVLGMSGAFAQLKSRSKTKFLGLEEPKHVAPLIYSTELSRSVALYPVDKVLDKNGKRVPSGKIKSKGRTSTSAGKTKKARNWLLADQMVYGLVNVRTDGNRIVLAVKKEDGHGFQIEEIRL